MYGDTVNRWKFYEQDVEMSLGSENKFGKRFVYKRDDDSVIVFIASGKISVPETRLGSVFVYVFFIPGEIFGDKDVDLLNGLCKRCNFF